MKIFLIVSIIVISFILISIYIPTIFISKHIYKKELTKEYNKDKWGRFCSAPWDSEQVLMYDKGLEFEKENKEYKENLEITNDNLKLYGEYFNFSKDKSVIIVCGRTESLLYSYYYAKPYKELGYNILVIDNRCHGLSEGNFIGVGFTEQYDVLAWAKLIHEKYNQNHIILHSICVGCASAIYALTNKDCPKYILGMVADGMYKTFYATFITHMKDIKKPPYPLANYVMLRLKKITKVNPQKYGPINAVKILDKPLLMIHSKEDIYSLPKCAQEIYDNSNKELTKLVWFDKGRHSHVRINNELKYDNTIKEFVGEYFKS